jgi:hypothetical protein
MDRCERTVEEVTRSIASKPPDGFLVRVLNEETRLVMFLKLGINGLAGICPLS